MPVIFQATITRYETTMNKIPATQLELTQLKRLAARRQLESDAKFSLGIQMVLNALSVVMIVFVAIFSKLDVWAPSFGVVVTFLNLLYFASRQQTLKEKATKIQELFDCDVLELDWRELMVGSRLEMETVVKYSSKYKRKHKRKYKPKVDYDSKPENWYSELENWYSTDVGKLPLHLGRVICQRSNCWWGTELRKDYTRILTGVLIFLSIGAFVWGIIGAFTLEKFILSVATPLMPAFVLLIQQHKNHTESVALLDKLRVHSENLWKKTLTGATPEEITAASRELQDSIYNHRRTGSLIFDWLYKHHRKDMEKQMKESANELIKEVLESLSE